MAYSIFTEDEKDKINDKLGSFDVTNQYMDIYGNNGSKGLDDEIAAQNKALQDIINNQYTEENQIRDDYDSLGSRAGRFLQVFGAGLRGENAGQVAQAQRDDLNKRLQNAQTRYRDRRDSASIQLKDLLNRKDALDKSKYERERDLVKDEQFNRTLDLNKTKADRDFGLEQQKLQMLRDSQNVKDAQAIKDQQNALDQTMQNEDEAYANLEYLSRFASDPDYFKALGRSKSKLAEIYLFNTAVANAAGVKPDGHDKWIQSNKALPNINDDYNTVKQKVNKILSQQPGYARAYTRNQERQKQETISETENLINNAKPGSFIKFPSIPDTEFLITADKELFEKPSKEAPNGRLYKFVNGQFVEIPIE